MRIAPGASNTTSSTAIILSEYIGFSLWPFVDEAQEAMGAVGCLLLGQIGLAIVFPLVSSESVLVVPAGIVRGMSCLDARLGPIPMLTLSVFISLAQANQMIKCFFGGI
jgi:hypothetical protein